MSGTLFDAKIETLEKERALLLEKYREVSNALLESLDPTSRPALRFSKARIEEQLAEKEAALNRLSGQPDEGADGVGGATLTGVSAGTGLVPREPGAPATEAPFPYLLDRSDQEEKLIDALVAHRREKRQRPFVCVIHGDELECHTSYLRRLKLRSLPQIISEWDLNAKKIPIEEFEIRLGRDTMTAADYEAALWSSLRTATHGSKPVTREEIINTIAAHKVAVIIETTLLTEDLRHLLPSALDLFFEFWNRWPDLSGHLLLFVSVSFKYQREPGPGWLKKAWSRARVNRRARQYLEQLDFGRFDKVQGVLLPELAAIRRGDAEALTRHKEARGYYGLGEEVVPSLEKDIRLLYNEQTYCTTDGCIPMETLLGLLVQIYREKQRQVARRF